MPGKEGPLKWAVQQQVEKGDKDKDGSDLIHGNNNLAP